MNDIEKAKSLLVDDNTCILIKDDKQYISTLKGISPMMTFIKNGYDLKDFSLADKIVGKAAAFLFVYAQIKEIYAEVISIEAINILEKYNIKYSFKTKTNAIINRKGDDICPMEKAVKDINNPKDAYEILKKLFSKINFFE